MTYIRHEITCDDGNSREAWRFWLTERGGAPIFVLDSHILYRRKTKRHKFRIEQVWDRLTIHRSTVTDPPEIPEEVEEQLRKEFMEQLTVRNTL